MCFKHRNTVLISVQVSMCLFKNTEMLCLSIYSYQCAANTEILCLSKCSYKSVLNTKLLCLSTCIYRSVLKHKNTVPISVQLSICLKTKQKNCLSVCLKRKNRFSRSDVTQCRVCGGVMCVCTWCGEWLGGRGGGNHTASTEPVPVSEPVHFEWLPVCSLKQHS